MKFPKNREVYLFESAFIEVFDHNTGFVPIVQVVATNINEAIERCVKYDSEFLISWSNWKFVGTIPLSKCHIVTEWEQKERDAAHEELMKKWSSGWWNQR